MTLTRMYQRRLGGMLAQLTGHNAGTRHYAKQYVTSLTKDAKMGDVQHGEGVSTSPNIHVATVADVYQQLPCNISLSAVDTLRGTSFIGEIRTRKPNVAWSAWRSCYSISFNRCIQHITACEPPGITGAVHSIVFSVMGYHEKLNVKCLQYGHENEHTVCLLYTKYSKQCHRHFDCEETGLPVSPSHPFMAASPGGLISCTCCGECALVMKSPMVYRRRSIYEFVETHSSHIIVDRSIQKNKLFPRVKSVQWEILERDTFDGIVANVYNKFYVQVECQLYCTGRNYCDTKIQHKVIPC